MEGHTRAGAEVQAQEVGGRGNGCREGAVTFPRWFRYVNCSCKSSEECEPGSSWVELRSS